MSSAKSNLLTGRYLAEKIIGEGASGLVASATDVQNSRAQVAVKRIHNALASPASAVCALRELKLLRLLRGHSNIVDLRDIVIPRSPVHFCDIHAVFELLPCDLARFLASPATLDGRQVRFLMFQLVRGVRYIHAAGVLHRDLQPSNILVDGECRLKICDFGLARLQSGKEGYKDAMVWTNYIAARWYRAPELIMPQDRSYGEKIDVWSVGCIFAEMLLRRPLLPGENSRDQLQRIIELTGKPDRNTIQKLRSAQAQELIEKMPNRRAADLKEIFPPGTDEGALGLISKMLQFDPDKRISAREALMDRYFDEWRRRVGFGKTPVVIEEDEFEFEKRLVSADNTWYYRQELLEEIALYHPERRKELVGGEDSPEEYDSVALSSPKLTAQRAVDEIGPVYK